jgi:hypothetical protein
VNGVVVKIPLSFGLIERVDPKFAPFGVLAECRNLRVRKDGRLGSRKGYLANSMTTAGGTLVAYDLFQHEGRLCALGSDQGDASPTDVYEAVGSTFAWRGSDPSRNQILTPMTEPFDCGNIPQVANGVRNASSAVGGGFLCVAWSANSGGANKAFARIVRQSNGQTLHVEQVGTATSVQVAFFGSTFYVQFANGGVVTIVQFTPGTSSVFTAFATRLSGGGTVDSHDIVPVTNASTGVVASGVSIGGSTTVFLYNSAGTQIGGTPTIALTAVYMTVDADQTDNTVNVVTTTSAPAGALRTFNFTSGALTLGPTVTTVGESATHCRLPSFAGGVQAIAVVTTAVGATSDVTVQVFSQSAHGSLSTTVLATMLARSRPIPAQSGTAKRGVLFAALVGPRLPLTTNALSGSTELQAVLVYASTTVAHIAHSDRGAGIDFSTQTGKVLLPNLSLDTTTRYVGWMRAEAGSLQKGGSGLDIPQLRSTLVKMFDSGRRQTAEYSGHQHISGCPGQLYDGVEVNEIGFCETPGIISTAGTTGGGGLMTNSGQYDYLATWEYVRQDGTVERAAVSDIVSLTLGPTQNGATVIVSTPHSIRVAISDAAFGSALQMTLYRSVWDPVTATKTIALFRTASKKVNSGMSVYGVISSVSDLTSDASLRNQGIVYTQASNGALSGQDENESPPLFSLVSSSSARVSVAGLARSFEGLESKEARIDEPIGFSSSDPAFSYKLPKRVRAISSQDGVRIVFSADDILVVAGEGPDDVGGNSLPPAVRLGSSGGIVDWKSLALIGGDLFFQLDTDKLYSLPRGAGTPEWVGVDVQSTLGLFPTVLGAAVNVADDAVCFACSNSGLTSARILVRSARTGIWSADIPPLTTSKGIESLCQDGSGIAYISGGTVFRVSTAFADQGGLVISTQWKTQPLYPFGIGGYGTMTALLATGEFRSAGDLQLRVSYDDGVSFTTYDTYTLTGLTVGSTYRRRWALQQSDATSLVLELTFVPSVAGEGTVLNELDLLVQPESGLREVDPLEAA